MDLFYRIKIKTCLWLSDNSHFVIILASEAQRRFRRDLRARQRGSRLRSGSPIDKNRRPLVIMVNLRNIRFLIR